MDPSLVRDSPLSFAGDRSPIISKGMQPHLLAWVRQRNPLLLTDGKEELAANLSLLARLRLDSHPHMGSRLTKTGDPQDGGRVQEVRRKGCVFGKCLNTLF